MPRLSVSVQRTFFMKQVSQINNIIKWGVIGCDLLVLNLLLWLFYSGCDFGFSPLGIISGREYILISNLCYLFCVALFPPILQMNDVRSDEIVRRVFNTVWWYAALVIFGTWFICKALDIFWMGILYYVILFLCLSVSRLVCRYLVKRMRRMGRNSKHVVFIGASSNMVELYKNLMGDPSCGYCVRGYFNDVENPDLPDEIPYLGEISQLNEYLEAPENHEIESVYCSLASNRSREILEIIDYCENHVKRFYSVPNVRNYLKRRMVMELVGDVPILYVHNEPLQEVGNRFIKRLFDVVCSGIFLCTLFPIIYVVVAIVIKLTSPGPVFFRQKRNGLNGKEFYCYKFRSMKVNALADTLQATENDPRKTKFGDFMRKTNIDELPQFINVFIGDMSLVGPRPHMVKHTEEYSELINMYMVRHFIKPGITGWAQVNGCRGETKELYQMEERIRKDIWYVEHWTFWLDLRIMWMTVRNMILRNEKNAY